MRLSSYDTFILVQLRCIQAAAGGWGRNGQRGYSAVEANQQGALQRLEGVRVTFTENPDLGSPWQFTIGQMSKGQGPGFISLYLKLCPPAGARAIQNLLSDL